MIRVIIFARTVSDSISLIKAQSAELVRKLMTYGMEQSGTECEMALQLLIKLYHSEERSRHSDKFKIGPSQSKGMREAKASVVRSVARISCTHSKREVLWQLKTTAAMKC
eukprot:4850444-Amphidinium_carterae.1